MPFTKELRNILKIIYQLYCIKTKDSSVIPIEKFVEQIVLQTPLPLGINEQLDIQIKLGDLINNTEIFSKKNYIYKGFENTIQDPLFVAPEFLEKKYNHKVDIWGVGMLAYLLFVGAPPFRGPKHKILYDIANEEIKYPPDLEDMKKSLLQKMLAKNPNERYDADALLKEEYFHHDLDESMDEAKAGKGFLNVVNSISAFTV